MLIESISGIRGIYPTHFNFHVLSEYTLAFHRFCKPGLIVIGRDSRSSGAKLISVLIDTLVSVGRDVQDCGICPTPTVQFVVEDTDAVGGIIITASHNPSDWNGLKFVTKDGCFINRDQFEQLLIFKKMRDKISADRSGHYSRLDRAIRRHVDRIMTIGFLEVGKIQKNKFKVAVDTVNGAASKALPSLLERLGCKVVKVNCELTGRFPRGPEPLPENLEMLSQITREKGCDVGFATDPDGDRLAVIDEKGDPLGDEYTLVLAVDDYLQANASPKIFVTNLSTTMAIDQLVGNYGGNVERTPVGEINVVDQMKHVNARLGGEGNGGVILRDVHLGRDSLVAAAIVLNRMVKTEHPISQIFATLPQYEIVKDKIRLEDISSEFSLDTLRSIFEDARVDRQDGIKFIWGNKWLHLRKSNTEPIIRIYAEALSKSEAKELIKTVISKL